MNRSNQWSIQLCPFTFNVKSCNSSRKLRITRKMNANDDIYHNWHKKAVQKLSSIGIIVILISFMIINRVGDESHLRKHNLPILFL